MKKVLSLVFIFSLMFALGAQHVFADVTTAPVVSIGVGNSNTPENTGPVSGSAYHGEIPVFATIIDDDLDNYHFRVIKDGDLDGYTCSGEGALFAVENQGHASTTLVKDVCGFVFNKSVYVSPAGFTNSLIATLNTEDIVAFSGEGEYWLILGALDTAGNRTNSNYLNDARVKITVSNSPVLPLVVTPTPAPAVSGGGGGGGGNGPVVGGYGVSNTGFSGGSNSANTGLVSPANTSTGTSNGPLVIESSSQDSGAQFSISDVSEMNSDSSAEDVSIETASESDVSSEEQTAVAVLSGFNLNWLWLLILIAILGGGYYFYFSKKK